MLPFRRCASSSIFSTASSSSAATLFGSMHFASSKTTTPKRSKSATIAKKKQQQQQQQQASQPSASSTPQTPSTPTPTTTTTTKAKGGGRVSVTTKGKPKRSAAEQKGQDAEEKRTRTQAALDLIKQATAKVEAARNPVFISVEEAAAKQQQQQQQAIDESFASLSLGGGDGGGGDPSSTSASSVDQQFPSSSSSAHHQGSSSSSITQNRISWQDVQQKVQAASVQLASCRPNSASELMHGARQMIRQLELSFLFLAEPKVCLAEHEDTLTPSMAIELVSSALRFSVPVHSPFIAGLLAFLAECIAKDGTFLDARNGPAHLMQLVSGASTVGHLRVWDERLLHRFQEQLKVALSKATLQELTGVLNGIGAKELGVTRVKHEGDSSYNSLAEGKSSTSTSSTSSSSTTTTDQQQQQQQPTASSLLITPSRLIPCLFQACTDRLDVLVQETLSSLRGGPIITTTTTSEEPSATSTPSVPVFVPRNFVIDAVLSFADSPLASDHAMRNRLREWIGALVETAPAASFHSTVQAASTLRLDNVFYPALRRAFELRQSLATGALAKILAAVMLLPRQPMMEVKLEFEGGGVGDGNSSSSVAFLEKRDDLTVQDLMQVAQQHLDATKQSGGEDDVSLGVSSMAFVPSATVHKSSSSSSNKISLDDGAARLSTKKALGNGTVVVQVEKKTMAKQEESNDNNNNDNNDNNNSKIAIDSLLFHITDRILSANTDDEMVARTTADVCADLSAHLAGAIAVQVTAHPAVQSAANFFYDDLLGGSNNNNKNSAAGGSISRGRAALVGDTDRLTGELEFLALAPHFRTRDETRQLLESVLRTVRNKIRDADMRNRSRLLTSSQLRLLCCSTLAVKFDLPVDVATFVLANFVELANEATLPDISAVVYTVGRTGIIVPEASHNVLARRVATVLRFAKASSRRFTAANVGNLRSSSGKALGTGNAAAAELTAHDLAVTLSGLHLTKFRWDHHPSLFGELAGAISARKKRYTPAQCCQIVAISRDIARSAQQRQKNVAAAAAQQQQQNQTSSSSDAVSPANRGLYLYHLSNDATKLARVFLPQIRFSIPTATDGDLLPLLSWLSTGHIRDVSLLDLIIERLISVRAHPGVSMSVLESVHCMGLLGGLNSDAVFRLVSSTMAEASPDQAAQLAFYATQLRNRDAELVKMLVAKAKKGSGGCSSIKSLCSAIGALSLVQVPWNSVEMVALTSKLETALDAYDAAEKRSAEEEEAAAAATAETLETGRLPSMPIDTRAPTSAVADDAVGKNDGLHAQITQSAEATATATSTLVAEKKTQKSPTPTKEDLNSKDIDVECIIFAMTAIAADEASPPEERTRFLNRLCSLLDAQLSLMPALRSQRMATKYSTASGNKTDEGSAAGNSSSSSLRAAIAASSSKSLPVTSLTNMMSEIAVQNLPVFSVFRVCGKCFVAPGVSQFMTPHDVVKALAAYAAFGFRDDFVIRALATRCFALKKSIAGNAALAKQCTDAMGAFHISFDAADGKYSRVADAWKAGGTRASN